jgi:hypothetical protein
MTDEEFDTFLSSAYEELTHKQALLVEQYGFGTLKRWWFDQTTEKLQLFDAADNLVIEADVIEIGTYSPISISWKWAWANDSTLPGLRKKAEPLKELHDITGIKIFGCEDAFEIQGEEMAWELAAFSVRHLAALGCYRAPSDGPTVFLAIMDVNTREV